MSAKLKWNEISKQQQKQQQQHEQQQQQQQIVNIVVVFVAFAFAFSYISVLYSSLPLCHMAGNYMPLSPLSHTLAPTQNFHLHTAPFHSYSIFISFGAQHWDTKQALKSATRNIFFLSEAAYSSVHHCPSVLFQKEIHSRSYHETAYMYACYSNVNCLLTYPWTWINGAVSTNFIRMPVIDGKMGRLDFSCEVLNSLYQICNINSL